METKNVLLAVILSTIILVFWATFFEAPIVEQQPEEKQITKSEDAPSPSIDGDQKNLITEITRNELISDTKKNKSWKRKY